MAFDPVAKLSEVLAGGYHRNTQLQALLSRPLDSRGQETAIAFSQELARVFAVSMAMLNSNAAASEIRTGNSSGVSTPEKDHQRARSDSGEVVTPSKKSREEGVTSKEITPSPHKDGYQWRKYGQKKIQNCNFLRYYYRCNRHRRCLAKKKVQQQNGHATLFEVTYVNEHTCHALRASDDAAARTASQPAGTTSSRHHAGATRSSNGGDLFDLFPHVIGGGGGGGSAEEENDAIVSCLATVVSGAALSPYSWWPPVAEASAGDPAAIVAPAGRSASVDGSVADDGAMMIDDETGFSSFCPVKEAGHHELVTTTNPHRDVHMDVAGFAVRGHSVAAARVRCVASSLTLCAHTNPAGPGLRSGTTMLSKAGRCCMEAASCRATRNKDCDSDLGPTGRHFVRCQIAKSC